MRIIKADYEDLREILDLQYLAYQSEASLCNDPNIPPLTQTLAEIQAEFAAGVILKAIGDDGSIIASVRGSADHGVLRIGKLMVRPDLQGQGIGTRLLLEIERLCPSRRYELFTSAKSERNIELYERLGYVRFKERDMGNGLSFVYLYKAVDE